MYTQISLDQLTTLIAQQLDDPGRVYWSTQEIQFAIYEGLRLWGALTNYWRTRGQFNLDPTKPNPYYDLSTLFPNLRTRAYTLGQMVQEIQYMLLEAPNGISGSGMSGQVGIQAILQSINVARNRFVLDTRMPISAHDLFGDPPPPDGLVQFDQESVFVHRVSWQDSSSGLWVNLWREDTWSADKGYYRWTETPGQPRAFSEAELAPLTLQLLPAPINEGKMDGLTVDSLQLDLTSPATTFNVPDEWVAAIKYAALSDLLKAGQISDDVRGDYAQNRYQQYVTFAKDARSIVRLMCNSLPLNLDTLDNLDAGFYAWRNQSGTPRIAGALYDIVAIAPGVPDQSYGIMADVVQTSPLPPALFDPTTWMLPMGREDVDHLISYCTHLLNFKCGGKDFTSTMNDYDDFMRAVAYRKTINAAKIRYFHPLFGQPNKEWAERADRVDENA